MGSLDRLYTLCEKCRGLFIDPDIAAGHVAECLGNIKISNCDFVACEKRIFLQYVQPKLNPTKKTPGRPRKKMTLLSQTDDTPKEISPESNPVTSALENHDTSRRYGLRKGAVAALHNKITDMQKTLGLHRKEKKEERKSRTKRSDINGTAVVKSNNILNESANCSQVEIEGRPHTSDGHGRVETGANIQNCDEEMRKKLTDKSNEGADKISTTEMAASILQTLKTSSNLLMDGRLTNYKPYDDKKDAVVVSPTANSDKHSEDIEMSDEKRPAQVPTKGGESLSKDRDIDGAATPIIGVVLEDGGTNSANAGRITDGDLYSYETTSENNTEVSHNYTKDHFKDVDNREGHEGYGEFSDNTNTSQSEKRSRNNSSNDRAAKKLKVYTDLEDEGSPKVLIPLPAPDADGVYHCNLCWYASPKEGMFRRHLGSHNDGNMYTCEFCNVQFLYRRLYRQHMGTHNGFQCEHCGKMFGRRHDRQRHIQTIHTGETKYECDICGYTCRHHHVFHDHKRKHTNDRFTCLVEGCSFKTIYRRALSHHINTVHNEEKNLVCDTCGYRTNDPSSFSKHKKTHDDLRKYKCSECDYTASTMGYVRSHMVSHATEKLYKCDQCEYTCVRRSGIRSHMMKHIGVKPWSCPNCEYSSTTKNKVKRHIGMRHKDNSEPQRQKIKIQFDTDMYRIDGMKQGAEGENLDKSRDTLLVGTSDDASHPKYVVIEMLDDDESGTALGSNLVGEEVVVQEINDPIHNKLYESVTDTSQENDDNLAEEDKDPGCLYKCALCPKVDSDLGVIQEHMSVVHSETETVTASEESVQYPGQTEIIIGQLLEAAASSTSGQQHDQEVVSDTIHSENAMHSGVACIYQAADGTVINPIEVEHISDHQIVALQDDAVSTAVESILHLQNIPIRGDVV